MRNGISSGLHAAIILAVLIGALLGEGLWLSTRDPATVHAIAQRLHWDPFSDRRMIAATERTSG